MNLPRRVAKAAIRRLSLGVREIPQFAIVPLPVPQDRIDVRLDSSLGPLDVTSNTVAVSLDPFLIAIGLSASSVASLVEGPTNLVFSERAGNRSEVGRLNLRLERSLELDQEHLGIFKPVAGNDRCLGRIRRSFYYGWKRWMARRDPAPQPTFADFKHLLTFYICPRSVALVSVMEDEKQGNMFPMDLIGQPSPRLFVAALKNSSRAIEVVQSTRRMVVSRIPFDLTKEAYALAKQHRLSHVEWQTLPFQLAKSAAFGFPIPTRALGALEIEVRETRPMGSHTAILGVVVNKQPMNEKVAGMHHVSGLYDDYCKAHERPLRHE